MARLRCVVVGLSIMDAQEHAEDAGVWYEYPHNAILLIGTRNVYGPQRLRGLTLRDIPIMWDSGWESGKYAEDVLTNVRIARQQTTKH